MKQRELARLIAICSAGLAMYSIGCGSAPDAAATESQTGNTDNVHPTRRTASTGPFHDTSVMKDSDGKMIVSVREVSAEYRAIQSKYRDKKLVAQLQRDMLAKEHPDQLASGDQVSCDNPDAMWLNTDYAQLGDRICFYSYDVGMPNGIPSGFYNNIYSWWAGSEWGALHKGSHPYGGDCDYLCPFDEGEREDYADSIGSPANPYCGPEAGQLNQNGYCFLSQP